MKDFHFVDAFLPFTALLLIADLESAELLMGRRNSLAIFPATKTNKKAIHQKKIIK
jgi:hypothetical protein